MWEQIGESECCTLSSQHRSMIGNWMRWKPFLGNYSHCRFAVVQRIRWFGSTKNVANSLLSLFTPFCIENLEVFPTSLVWNPQVPMRVCFLAWKATWGRILTLEQLKRRGWKSPNKCFMSKGDEETVDHILLHYSKATTL